MFRSQNTLLVAGTIMGTEVRHASWINQGPIHRNPWNTAFEVDSISACISDNVTYNVPLSDTSYAEPGLHVGSSSH